MRISIQRAQTRRIKDKRGRPKGGKEGLGERRGIWREEKERQDGGEWKRLLGTLLR
jgi:hypothetical protein